MGPCRQTPYSSTSGSPWRCREMRVTRTATGTSGNRSGALHPRGGTSAQPIVSTKAPCLGCRWTSMARPNRTRAGACVTEFCRNNATLERTEVESATPSKLGGTDYFRYDVRFSGRLFATSADSECSNLASNITQNVKGSDQRKQKLSTARYEY